MVTSSRIFHLSIVSLLFVAKYVTKEILELSRSTAHYRDVKQPEGRVELEQKIHDWLHLQGYSLEMKVAKTFRELGFEVQQSDYYFDEEVSTYRELDVIARYYKDTELVHYCVSFLIECKVCKSHPWLVFKSKEKNGGNYKLIMFPGNELGTEMISLYNRNKKVTSLQLLCKHNSLGYSVVETLRGAEKKDNSYSSLMSLSKALSAYSNHPKYTHSAGKDICEIFFQWL